MTLPRLFEIFEISKISNSLGKVTEVTYDSSVREALRASDLGETWAYKLPHPATLVVEKKVYDGLNDVTQVLSYDYRDGYYDGDEKQFRGYQRTQTSTEANAFQAAGIERQEFNLGIPRLNS